MKQLFLYLEWESNPHTVVHEFESCASTNSAIQALALSGCKCKKYYLISGK